MSRVLLGVSGGIAAYKACELVRLLTRRGHEVRVMMTAGAVEFVTPLTLQTLSGHPVRSELFAPGEESQISHIELADWADVVVLAPATANLIASLAQGLANDLVTTVCLATRAAVLVAPAMNVNMLQHPATQANLATLQERGVQRIGPDRGDLACGWTGEGRMVDPEVIVAATERLMRPAVLAEEAVLITAGPTEEPLDPVRVLSNRSSGKMGFALADEAAKRGAEVILIAGPVSLPTPIGVRRIDVRTAEEMRSAVFAEFEHATVVIKTAAVADYRAADTVDQKIKRESADTLEIKLVRNPDILREISAAKGERTVVGFAAETENVLANARDKLKRKGCDLIVVNDVSRADIGFDVDQNEVTIVGPTAEETTRVPLSSKVEIAAAILDRIIQVRKT